MRSPQLSGAGRPFRLLALGALVGAALAGCARDNTTTGSLPDDYRTRHPIVVAEAEQVLDVPISSGDRRLTQGAREVIRGFAQAYKSASAGVVQIMLPSGSPNAAAADYMRREIRTALVTGGVPANRLVEMHYQAGGPDDAAPVRLRYTAITAQTGPCGKWPSDLVVNTMENKNYENFGCASQANLAAQIANPMDLLGPREMSPIDATQRGEVIKDYRGIATDAAN
ncbi:MULTISPECIES: CpaD family pilus assembly protein [unclassified Rhizobium]|uniref:CpaD family pilus assembly protein n=1 Tax=unclassified Rhizobium TaxID=2613769 RepID=UPI0006FD8848|nr:MULTISPECIES: CpaD family pilus assembly protein [unclassified Rhizobium]KQV44611.1 pilus assembly protein [Rhizobium sp. Root1212]KRD38794.1 pilus assembly protein [Rhizobium sp. Root268]